MEALWLIAVLCGAGCVTHERFPMMPFVFIGVLEKIGTETYLNVHVLERSVVVRVLEVTKGSYDRSDVAFGIPADAPSPLEDGRKYQIRAAWGRHGMLMLDAKPFEEPSQSPKPAGR
jgi:hypothetical protein